MSFSRGRHSFSAAKVLPFADKCYYTTGTRFSSIISTYIHRNCVMLYQYFISDKILFKIKVLNIIFQCEQLASFLGTTVKSLSWAGKYNVHCV